MTANGYGVLAPEDVAAARLLVDAWAEEREGLVLDASHLPELRGMVAQLCSDCRTAGYLEGIQRGRQEAAHVVLDALRGEGLAP
jgi:hypothetical protein